MFSRFFNSRRNIFLCGIAIALATASCRPTKFVPDNSYLLSGISIKKDKSAVTKRELKEIQHQPLNQKIVGFLRFNLWVHNVCMTGKKNRVKKWMLETLGEAPSVYDPLQAEKTRQLLEQHMKNNGYLDATVEKKEKIRGKRLKVIYTITSRNPYYIGSYSTYVSDSGYQKTFHISSDRCLIEPGSIFKIGTLQAERDRITRQMKENGYFYFDNEAITFEADTSRSPFTIDVSMSLIPTSEDSSMLKKQKRKYKVRNTWFVGNFDNSELLKNKQSYLNSLDTIALDSGAYLLCKNKPIVKQSVYQNSNMIKPNDYFNISDVEKTKNYLGQNKIFRQITVDFNEVNNSISNDSIGYLDCYFLVSNNVRHSYSIDLEGTNTGGDLGAQINLGYENKNVFNGAEQLTLRFRNSYEQNNFLAREENLNQFNSQENGVDATVEFPKFFFPFWKTSFSKNYRVRTLAKGGISYQRIPYYERQIRYLSYGYVYRNYKATSHYFTPFEINGVQYFNKSNSFYSFIDQRPYYKYSYEDYYISSSSYTFILNTQSANSTRDNIYLKINSEIAGNLLSYYCSIAGYQKKDGYYTVLDTRFAQYAKIDLDARYYIKQGLKSMQVYRLFCGVARAYGNSEYMPNIKKYYSGGSNSMRGWGVRSLGPGSYSIPDSLDVAYAMGDVKIEMNAEQRFPIAGILNGALFVDIGNIWSVRENEPGSKFSSQFYQDAAISTGMGIRLDFSFFVLRFDSGLKTRNPALKPENRWIWNKKFKHFDDVNYSIAIGYPF